MPHFQQLFGRPNRADIYDLVLPRARQNAVFVAVGAYRECSTLALAQRIQLSGKTIRLYVVERWDAGRGDEGFRQFIGNVRRVGVEEVVYPLRMESERAAELFDNGTLDFVFVAGAGGHESMRRNLENWFAKVKQRGLLGGGDYRRADVRRAADAFSHEQQLPLRVLGTSFLVVKHGSRWFRIGA